MTFSNAYNVGVISTIASNLFYVLGYVIKYILKKLKLTNVRDTIFLEFAYNNIINTCY